MPVTFAPTMQLHAEHIINRFCVAGINHTCATAEVRGSFAVDQAIHTDILLHAKELGLSSVFVVSTCNRTEIYGYAHHACELAALLTKFTRGDLATFMEHSYRYQGNEAMDHLFRVACGLDSQIIGDFEIQGQLKQAYTYALQLGMIGPIMDRTINFVFQASKKIRSSTALSTGTVSVSFAAIEWLQKNTGKSSKKILLVGSGKFGRNVCKNIRHYLPNCLLTITNRTSTVGAAFAFEVGASFLPFEQLGNCLNEFDVILVCTNAMEPVIKAEHFQKSTSRQIIIDLSVPSNVEAAVGEFENVRLVNVDEISAITISTIARRNLEIPKAEAIICDFESQFCEWLQTYQHAPAIRHIKENLRLLSIGNNSKCEMSLDWETGLPASLEHDEHIRKTVNTLVYNLKTKKEKGCQFISAYNNFLSREALS
ncbi:MAG: glutamyl-tRNA reductase [Bacteroidota bacterium]